MNRRQYLNNLKNFCLLYGISGILSPHSFAQNSSPTRMINFIVKYTGGTTAKDGLGFWNTNQTLKPLKAFENELMTPLGLNCEFNNPMNSHSTPQLSALTGSLTGYKLVNPSGGDKPTPVPDGNLQNYTEGEGKSIDLIIGEALQKKYNTPLSVIPICNHSFSGKSSTTGASTWDKGGIIKPSFATLRDLSNEINSHLKCLPPPPPTENMKLLALKYVKSNINIFKSNYLIDKDKFEKTLEYTQKIEDSQKTESNNATLDTTECNSIKSKTYPRLSFSQTSVEKYNEKVNAQFELALLALKYNVTRSITFNLHMNMTHETSHFGIDSTYKESYLGFSQVHQQAIARFLNLLKSNNLYDDSLIFCNAGSSMHFNLHNHENLAAYVINGGKSGTVGSSSNKKPIGALLNDILAKFNINYAKYGASDHKLGIGQKGFYL